MEGWVKFHRKIEDWEWYTDANTFRVFFHLVMKANHKDKKWQGIEVKRGQLITSVDSISKSLKLSVRQIRTALDKLKTTNELTIKTTSRYTLVTVANYDVYQIKDEEVTNQMTNKMTNERQTYDKQTTTNKNVRIKECEEEKKKDIYRKMQHLVLTVDEFEKLKSIYGEVNVVEVLDSMDNYAKLKNYASAYKTALNWLKKRNPNTTQEKPQAKREYTPEEYADMLRGVI
jgi:hypothetical protein